MGGTALTAGAGYLQGQAQKGAAKDQQAYDEKNLYAGMARQAFQQYGADGGEAWIRANIPKDVQAQLFGTADFQQEIIPAQQQATGANRPRGILALAGQAAAPQGNVNGPQYRTVKGQPGIYDLAAMKKAAGRGIINETQDVTNSQLNEQRGVTAGAEALVANARGYGNARKAEIERDAARQQMQLNAFTGAQAKAAGISGGSVQSRTNAENAKRIFEGKTSALTSLDMDMQDRMTELQRSALATQMAGMDRSAQLQMNPINARSGVAQSQIMNPWLQRESSPYFTGTSSWGNAIGTIGTTGSSIGGLLLADQLSKKK